MIKRISLLLIVSAVIASSAGFAMADTVTLPNPLCRGGVAGDNCIENLPQLISKIATYISTIVGALAVLMFMWAGICFLLSGVMPSYLDKGKHALWYAIIGTGIALAGVGLVAVITAVIGNAPA